MHWNALGHFSWLWFGVLAAIYTAWVFGGEFSKGGPRIFSSRNARALGMVLSVHAGFLLVVFGIYMAAVTLSPSMPKWMFGSAGRNSTWYETFVIAVLVVLGLVERVWLFVEAAVSDSVSALSREDER